MSFKQGLSLIETIIYVAIFAIASIIIMNGFLTMAKSFNVYKVMASASVAGEVAMERITREIRLSDDITTISSVFDVHPGKLVLSTIDPDTELPETITIYASGVALMIQKGTQNANVLTPENIELTNLIFRQVAASSNVKSKVIKIELEIKGSRGSYQKSLKFYNTAVLRRSYE